MVFLLVKQPLWKVSSPTWKSNSLGVEERLNPATLRANIIWSLGPKLKVTAEGSISLTVSIEDEIISFLMVLIPMLKKRAINTPIINTVMIPPEVDLYSASPLYLRNLLLWKKSNILNNLEHCFSVIGFRNRIFDYFRNIDFERSISFFNNIINESFQEFMMASMRTNIYFVNRSYF